MKIGILGDGQLARMLALSAYPLGFSIECYGTDPTGSAGQVAPVTTGSFDDIEKLATFLNKVDVLTYESENIPWEKVINASPKFANHSNWQILHTAQDRLLEKTRFTELGINTPNYIRIDSLEDLHTGAQQIKLPAVLKTRRFGYDGKGQYIIHSVDDIPVAWKAINQQPAILEAFVNFDRELSIVAVRDQAGDTRCYDLSENHHTNGILRVTKAPIAEQQLQQQAANIAQKLLNHFHYVGTFCIELFQQDNHLLANEMAPRVHNSGHWTIEGAVTSQFENHIRAITGMPLGSTKACGHSIMINCIGAEPAREEILAIKNVHLHSYSKTARSNRKLGHITINTETENESKMIFEQLKNTVI